jgi:lipopolysaccharide transport protein LptA
VIEYLVMAFFAGQPVKPAAGAPDAGARPSTQSRAPQLSAPVEISSKLVSGSRSQANFTGNVVVKHRTMDLRCDEMIAHYNGPREVTRVECVGNVRAVDGERTAQGERADFDVPAGVLVVTGNPEARDAKTRLRGSQVRLTLGTRNYEVENAVVTADAAPLAQRRKGGGRESPAPSTPAEISARRVSGTPSQAVFTGDVVVKHRTMDLRCDKMIASYNSAGEVTRSDCVGNVRAVDGVRTAKGERAEFNVPTGVLVLTGNPEARDPTTHLRGTRVRMTLGNENFEVENAVITVETAPLREQQRKGEGKGNPGSAPGNTKSGGTKQP